MFEERGRRRARAAPRLGSRGSWSYTARPTCAVAAESRRPGTIQRPGGARPRRAHTTTPLPGPEEPSRCAGSSPEGVEVSPLVAGLDWVSVVRRVRSIDFDRAVAGQESSERLIDERGIRQLRTCPSRAREQLLVDRRAHPHSCHATLIPHLCHAYEGIDRCTHGGGDAAG
jgi:hypothetical protein